MVAGQAMGEALRRLGELPPTVVLRARLSISSEGSEARQNRDNPYFDLTISIIYNIG